MINIIGSILTSLVFTGVIWYSEVKSNERQKKEFSGKYRLKANFLHKVTGVVLIIIAIVLMNVMILNWNEEIKIIALITTCLFLIPGIIILMFYYNYSIEFNESRVITVNWRGIQKTFNWNDIVKVKFIDSLKCLYIKSNSSKTLINQNSVGFINFIEMLELKTNYRLNK